MSVTSSLQQFRKVGSSALLVPPSHFLVVGDELLVMGSVDSKLTQSAVVSLSKKETSTTSLKEYLGLYRRAQALGTRSLADFTLQKAVLRRLKDTAKDLNSTHVRFFAHEQRGIVARLFDVRVGSDLLLPRIKRIHASATLDVSKADTDPFSMTITVATLKLLPNDALLMSVYEDGIMVAEPVAANPSHWFVCRDQGVHEPYTSFQHEKLGRTVYFVQHASS